MCGNENQITPLLLIDDDPTVLESFKLWLEDEGYYLHTAASKEEALEILKHHPVDVCLIDLKMKEENGLQVTEEVGDNKFWVVGCVDCRQPPIKVCHALQHNVICSW